MTHPGTITKVPTFQALNGPIAIEELSAEIIGNSNLLDPKGMAQKDNKKAADAWN